MASESSALVAYSSGVQNVASLLSNREIDIDDRFDLVAQTLLTGAQIVKDEREQRVDLQGRVQELTQETREQKEMICGLEKTQKQRLEFEAAEAMKEINRKDRRNEIASIAVPTTVALLGVFPMIGFGALCPPTLAATIPAYLTGVAATARKYVLTSEKIRKEKFILRHYPESKYNDEIRKKAEEGWVRNLKAWDRAWKLARESSRLRAQEEYWDGGNG